MYGDDQINTFKFGPIEFRTRGLGVFFATPKLKGRIEALSDEEVRAVNREAWKVRKAAERDMSRYSNVTVHGNHTYDCAAHEHSVAKEICSVSYRRMNLGAAIPSLGDKNCGGVGRKLVPPAGPRHGLSSAERSAS